MATANPRSRRTTATFLTMILMFILILTFIATGASVTGCATTAGRADMSPLESLKEGNQRFYRGRSRHPHEEARLRKDLAEHGQHPFATVLACSDSRVPVELLFDQGLGDLFVVRVAGNVVGTDETASVEYAVEHLHCPLVVVLGHRRCGAVTAAVEHEKDTPSIEGLLKHIYPAVREARQQNGDAGHDELIDAAVEQNVRQSMNDLVRVSGHCRGKIESGELQIIGAIYDIESGVVRWLNVESDAAGTAAVAATNK